MSLRPGGLPACLLLFAVACASPLERGERLYREGDRLGALETWRDIPEGDSSHARSLERIHQVETEFPTLVTRYKQRARHFEDRDRLAESILNDRLALKLQPDDAETLARVQEMARTLDRRKTAIRASYERAFERADLATARRHLEGLRSLDPFDPEIEAEQRQLEAALEREVTRLLELGQGGFSVGNYDSAQRAFRSVLGLDPDNESARGYLSYIATIQHESGSSGEQPAAFDAPQRFASDAEIRAEGFYQNALAAERAGDVYAAIRHDERALAAYDGHDAARSHLAQIRHRLRFRVTRLIESGRDAFRSEDLQTALELWRRALLLDPGNERAKAYIARAERQLGNLERLRAEPESPSDG